MALLALASPAWAQSPDAAALSDFVAEMAACVPGRMPLVAIAGFARDETSVTRAQADGLRHALEARLSGERRLRLAPAADGERMRALLEGAGGLSPVEAERRVRTAFSGDLAVFFVSPQRSEMGIRFRLQAIAREGACKATSAVLDMPLETAATLAEPAPFLAGAVARALALAPEATEIGICPIAGIGGHSPCATALTDRLLAAVDDAARDPNRLLKGRPLGARRLSAKTCATAPETEGGPALAAHGRYEADRQGRATLALEFRRGAQVLAPTGAVPIATATLACDPTIRPFLDHVAAGALSGAGALTVSTPGGFTIGQRLEVRIETTVAAGLYCWVLAPDETAFAVLPVAGAKTLIAPGLHRYPAGFGLSDIVLDAPFENLFGCFSSASPLPEALAARWQAVAPAQGREAVLLSPAETRDLLDAFRALPDMREAVTRMTVKAK